MSKSVIVRVDDATHQAIADFAKSHNLANVSQALRLLLKVGLGRTEHTDQTIRKAMADEMVLALYGEAKKRLDTVFADLFPPS